LQQVAPKGERQSSSSPKRVCRGQHLTVLASLTEQGDASKAALGRRL
jgi:hypothetical protein